MTTPTQNGTETSHEKDNPAINQPLPQSAKTSPSKFDAEDIVLMRSQMRAMGRISGESVPDAAIIEEYLKSRAEHASATEKKKQQQDEEFKIRLTQSLAKINIIPPPDESNAQLARRLSEARAVEDADFQKRQEESSRRARAELNFKYAECPERHIRNMGQMQCPEWTAVLDRISKPFGRQDGYLVALLGQRGTGKTQLAVAAIHRACRIGMSARYVKAMDLFRAIRSTYGPAKKSEVFETEEDVVEKLSKFKLLVIDELHQRGETAAEQNTLTNLLDRRYDAMRFTILIANQTRPQFSESMGGSVVSRIHETGAAIECNWASFRKPGMWEEK